MTCEEFEAIGLDASRDASLGEAERAAAKDHLDHCPRCAALQNSWQVARRELRAFAEATGAAEARARVEMRLRREFGTEHRTLRARRAAVVAVWALAAAAVLVGAISWTKWRRDQREEAAKHQQAPQNTNALPANKADSDVPAQNSAEDGASEALLAGNELGDFTLLPGVLPVDTDNSAIVRVRMQRGMLGSLGLPVNEERAAEWIQVDLLVGDDGLPQAVRLPQ